MSTKSIVKVGLSGALVLNLGGKAIEASKKPDNPNPIKEANSLMKGYAALHGSTVTVSAQYIQNITMDYYLRDANNTTYQWYRSIEDRKKG